MARKLDIMVVRSLNTFNEQNNCVDEYCYSDKNRKPICSV